MHVFTTFLCLDVVYANVFRNSTILLRHTSEYIISWKYEWFFKKSVTTLLTNILVKTNASLIEKFISSSKYQSNENTNVCLEEIKDCLENIFLWIWRRPWSSWISVLQGIDQKILSLIVGIMLPWPAVFCHITRINVWVTSYLPNMSWFKVIRDLAFYCRAKLIENMMPISI